jgi:NitT/TauT family transport system substrate-binding protein
MWHREIPIVIRLPDNVSRPARTNFAGAEQKGIAMLRDMIAAFVIVIISACHVAMSFALDPLRVGWAGFSASHAPLWVAEDKGLLKKQGLAAEVIFFSNGPTALQALVAGELDVVLTSAPNVVNPRLAGVDTIMILAIIPTFVDHIVAAAAIHSPEQLKGKIGGVNRQGSVSEMGLRLALRRLGLDPEKDTRIVSSGGNPERLAALSKGIVQFVILSEPFVREAEKLGFRDLVDIASLKIPLLWNGVVTRESIIKAKRPAIARFVRAITEAIHDIKTDKEGTKAVLEKKLKISDPEGLDRTYKNYAAVLLDVPYPAPAGIKTLLDDMAPRNAKAAAADPRDFVDPSFVREMESSGFIRQLSAGK